MVAPNAYNIGKNAFNTFRAGPGIREGNLHPSTGLRSYTQHIRGIVDDHAICGNATGADGADIADNADWTALALSRGGVYSAMPYPCTPVVRFHNTNPTGTTGQMGQTLSLRVTGRNQFGDSIVETTPTLAVNANPSTDATQGQFTYFWLSKVFGVVHKVEYRADNVDPGAGDVGGHHVDTVSVGVRPLLDQMAASQIAETTTRYIYGTSYMNFGFGTPVRCRPHMFNFTASPASITPNNDRGQRDILSMQITNGSDHAAAQAAYMSNSGFSVNPSTVGGWTIGQTDDGDSWQGYTQKWGFFNTTADSRVQIPETGTASALPSAWGDVWEITAHFNTSLGLNNVYAATTYGEGRTTTRVPTA